MPQRDIERGSNLNFRLLVYFRVKIFHRFIAILFFRIIFSIKNQITNKCMSWFVYLGGDPNWHKVVGASNI